MSYVGDDGAQKAGQVNIETLKLVNEDNVVVDLNEFLVELNIYEDMFSNYMYGNVVITDSRNLIKNLNLHGEEFLNVKFRTPSFDDSQVIEKTFRIYKLTDREIVRDNNTQNFTLHFVSVELFYDMLLPLFIPFEGKITDVVAYIFSTYISTNRRFDVSEDEKNVSESEKETELIIIDESKNSVKFIAAGWTPFKCINWLASKSISETSNAKNYLFFESNKNFYFGTLEGIFEDAVQNDNYIGRYFISASNIRDDANDKNLNRELFIAREATMTDTTDYIKNYTNGYLANRLIYLDVYNKEYKQIDYDHVESYKNQFHTAGSGQMSRVKPLFNADSYRNPATNISFYPKNPKLFDDFTDNVNEKMDEIYGNRLSSLLELTNLKMNITVPGRTDVEVGRLLYFEYPGLGAKEGPLDADAQDPYYSGYYLITAINHRISKSEHTMNMEIVKDSIYVDSNEA